MAKTNGMNPAQEATFRSEETRARIWAAVDRTMEFALNQAETVARLPLVRLPETVVMAEIVSRLMGKAVLALGTDRASREHVLEIVTGVVSRAIEIADLTAGLEPGEED